MVRYAWLALGWLLFGVGIVGVVVPGLPTTGPMLLALACFARGSARLHAWLLNHAVFGPPLRDWQERRVIPLRAKVIAVSMMAGSFAYVFFLTSLPGWVVALIGGFILIGMVVVLSIRHECATSSEQSAK
jgi:uncharacterized membrane protein YbaN (DUF454 family)